MSTEDLQVDLTADQANAVVRAITLAITEEAEELGRGCEITHPGELPRFGERTRRVARLAAVNEQLEWRVHWSEGVRAPDPICAPAGVLIDIVAELHKRAEGQRRYGADEVDGAAEYNEAARTIALVFAGAAGVTA